MLKPSDIDIVGPDGTVRCQVKGYYAGTGKEFIIDDMKVDVRVGDEIRRLLPNGKEEAFIVEDPKYIDSDDFGEHYRVSISRPQTFERHKGGNYHISVSGTNSRVNIKSHDSSSNLSVHGTVYDEIRQTLAERVSDDNKLSELKSLLQQIETARDQPSFLKAYQIFIAATADHITILTPFLPALTNLMTQFAS
jgi:hypothetical protein